MTMGRSAKEHCRPDQMVDGGGMVMGSKIDGKDVKPESEESSGMKLIKKAITAYAKQQASESDSKSEESSQDKSGWDKIGQAGEDIIKAYYKKKNAGSSSSSSSSMGKKGSGSLF